jgi:hypothetical protein
MSVIKQFNLRQGQRAERKTLITVAEWTEYTLTTSAPADWSTKYMYYFTRSQTPTGYVYDAVPTGDEAPTWAANKYFSASLEREIMGTRTEDSSIEYNTDIATSTDILGNNYSDVNKTQPEQGFDPFLVLGGSKLGAFLNDIRRRNALSELDQFTMYIITAFIGDATNGYETEKQTGCTISYDSIGGDVNVNFPITVHFSNKITTGKVDKLSSDFAFTPDVTV